MIQRRFYIGSLPWSGSSSRILSSSFLSVEDFFGVLCAKIKRVLYKISPLLHVI